MLRVKQQTLQINSLQLLSYQAPLSVMFLIPIILVTEPLNSERGLLAVWSYDTTVCLSLGFWLIWLFSGVSAYAAWHQMVPVCSERWCMEANEATQTHCYNPVTPAYRVSAYYVHGWQCRCQEDPVSLPSGRLEKTTRLSRHHVAQHRPTGSETTPPYAPRSRRFGSEPPSVEDDVDVILELHARNDNDDDVRQSVLTGT